MSKHEDLKKVLDNINPDTDCVAIFKPKGGVHFHIPDEMLKAVKVGGNLPAYIMAVLLHVHLYKYFDSDPTVKEFADKFRDQIYLDLMAEG